MLWFLFFCEICLCSWGLCLSFFLVNLYDKQPLTTMLNPTWALCSQKTVTEKKSSHPFVLWKMTELWPSVRVHVPPLFNAPSERPLMSGKNFPLSTIQSHHCHLLIPLCHIWFLLASFSSSCNRKVLSCLISETSCRSPGWVFFLLQQFSPTDCYGPFPSSWTNPFTYSLSLLKPWGFLFLTPFT